MKKAVVIWFTGLSGSGKTTVANRVSEALIPRDKKVKIFDGDTVRKKITGHLTFSSQHIEKNNRIIAELCLKSSASYDYILVPIISPFERCRTLAKSIIGDPFYLVYMKASVKEVIKRDPKGLYKKALNGEIENFIGIDKAVPYEPPRKADLVLYTEREDIAKSVARLIGFIDLMDAKRPIDKT